MITFNALKPIITLLEENNIEYYVFGGIALDGLRQTLTREHGDLDIYIADNDLERFCTLMSAQKYPCSKREQMYFIDHDTLKIGIVVLTKEKDHYISNGNKTREVYPKRIFRKEHYGKIDGFRFRIVPNEILAFDSQYSKHPEDKRFGTGLTVDEILCKQITHQVVRASRKHP